MGDAMLHNYSIRTEKATITGFFCIKAPYWAVFCHFQEKFTLSSCFLHTKTVKVTLFQVLTGLVRNKIRIAICQKQLHLSHFFWSLDYLHAQTLHLLQARHRSQHQSRLWNQFQRKNTKDYSQEPIAVLGTSQMRACGGVS